MSRLPGFTYLNLTLMHLTPSLVWLPASYTSAHGVSAKINVLKLILDSAEKCPVKVLQYNPFIRTKPDINIYLWAS